MIGRDWKALPQICADERGFKPNAQRLMKDKDIDFSDIPELTGNEKFVAGNCRALEIGKRQSSVLNAK